MGGVSTFTRSHKGAYMDLLMAQYNDGHLSLQDIKIVLGVDFDIMWEQKLKSKFIQDDKGLFFNKKLEEVISKRRAFTESRKENLKGKKTHKTQHKGSHMGDHMENENEDVNINVSELENSKDLHEKLTFAFWQLFDYNMDRFGVNSTDLSKVKSKNWIQEMRRMIEIDKRSEEDISLVYGYLKTEEQNKGFAWAMNVRSISNLRKNFEKILIKAKNRPGEIRYDFNDIMERAKR